MVRVEKMGVSRETGWENPKVLRCASRAKRNTVHLSVFVESKFMLQVRSSRKNKQRRKFQRGNCALIFLK